MFECALAYKYEPKRFQNGGFASVKIDGCRALYKRLEGEDGLSDDGQFHFVTRNQKVWRDEVVAHVLNPLREFITNENIILDGELFDGESCQSTISKVAARKKHAHKDAENVKFYIFDVFFKDDPNETYSERYDWIESLFNNFPFVEIVKQYKVNTEDELMELHAKHLDDGEEGTIFKYDGPYHHGRRPKTFKLKKWQDDEFKVVDFVEGKDTDKGGKYQGMLGAVVLELPWGGTCEAGSGYSDEQRRDIWDNKEKYRGKYATIQHFGRTKDDSLRFPIFKAFRDYE